MDPYIGEIRLVPFNFAPQGWERCQGQLLPINQSVALFELIGTTYGGDGQQTFALPNLQSRVPIHMGAGYTLGQQGGYEAVSVSVDELPAHQHNFNVAKEVGTTAAPSGAFLAVSPAGLGYVYGTGSETQMALGTIASAGQSLPHDNVQPYLTLNYIISLFGIFPTQ